MRERTVRQIFRRRVREATAAADRLRVRAQTTFLRFLQAEATGGVLLIIATVVAMVLANSRYAEPFAALWQNHLELRFGRFAIELTVHEWINDGLMACFFLVVGLEIKRELLQGELASFRRAALPVLAAVGGMAAPGLIFTLVTSGTGHGRGWGIPTATDIAFTVGVMTLLGRRVPLWSKVFVTALAIADDLGAVVVIALFYSGKLVPAALIGVVGSTLLLIGMNRLGVRRLAPYLLVGAMLWVAMLRSGVHATLAGVILGMCIPLRESRPLTDFLDTAERALRVLRSPDRHGPGDGAEPGADEAHSPLHHTEHKEAVLASVLDAIFGLRSPLHRLGHALHDAVALGVLPLFALCNAGVRLPQQEAEIRAALAQPVTAGVFFGLLVGKPLGILIASYLAVKLRLGELPAGGTFRQLLGAALLAGIGFTMSIFITGLAYADADLVTSAKLGILGGSLVSATLGALWLRFVAPARPAPPPADPSTEPGTGPGAQVPVPSTV
ncbi:MAG: Na+/H+ antiporter NhaA [Polyangia bacterium]